MKTHFRTGEPMVACGFARSDFGSSNRDLVTCAACQRTRVFLDPDPEPVPPAPDAHAHQWQYNKAHRRAWVRLCVQCGRLEQLKRVRVQVLRSFRYRSEPKWDTEYRWGTWVVSKPQQYGFPMTGEKPK